MDTPLKNQTAPFTSVFQDSPVSNYISNLSPIGSVKFIRNDHTINSLAFASPPSGFTPPHIVSPCGNKFLLKRHHFSEGSKPDIDGSCDLNCTREGESVVSGQLECSVPVESLEPATELPSTLKLSGDSLESDVVPCDATKTDHTPEPIIQSDIHQPKGGQSSFEREGHLRRICRGGFDWEMSIADTANLLNLDSPTVEENSAGGEDPKTDDPGVMSFISNILVDDHNDVEIRSSEDPIDSSEQIALTKFNHSEIEHCALNTVDAGTCSFISDILQEDHTDMEMAESVGLIDSSEQCELEKFNTSETSWDLIEIDQVPAVISQPLLDLNVNPSDTAGSKRQKCNPPSFKPSSQSHTIRRRCLVFEKAETHEKISGTCSVSLTSDYEDPNVNKELIETTTGAGSAYSSAKLPGFGLHLNALATSSETNLAVSKHENLASESQVMIMSSSMTCYTSFTPGEHSCDGSSILNYSEDEPVSCKSGVLVAESSPQTCNQTFEELEHSTPKRERVKRKRLGESGPCKHCNCKRSKCLKLYCECFAAGLYCIEPCSCHDCFNKIIHEDIVHETRRLIELRNPLAFSPKVVGSIEAVLQSRDETNSTPTSARHKRGCNCKKSSCLKRYCECFQGGAGCSSRCRCVGCKNTYGQRSGGLESEATEVQGKSGVQEKHNPTILNDICRPCPDQLPTTDLKGASKQISLHSSQSSVLSPPRLEKHLQVIPEDETFEALDRPSTTQPGSIFVKSASPNSKRVSPPHIHNSLSKFGSITSWKGGRKFTLRSVLPDTKSPAYP